MPIINGKKYPRTFIYWIKNESDLDIVDTDYSDLVELLNNFDADTVEEFFEEFCEDTGYEVAPKKVKTKKERLIEIKERRDYSNSAKELKEYSKKSILTFTEFLWKYYKIRLWHFNLIHGNVQMSLQEQFDIYILKRDRYEPAFKIHHEGNNVINWYYEIINLIEPDDEEVKSYYTMKRKPKYDKERRMKPKIKVEVKKIRKITRKITIN